MAEKIPITFEYQGKTYSGSFNAVCGAGVDTGVWYLMINNFYYGRLRTSSFGWFFDGNIFNDLADYFGAYVIACYDSRII
jgi:hypothetical protein